MLEMDGKDDDDGTADGRRVSAERGRSLRLRKMSDQDVSHHVVVVARERWQPAEQGEREVIGNFNYF